jgi:TetR/AcrR family transcriptional regulator, transcriptional repressor for nem operon
VGRPRGSSSGARERLLVAAGRGFRVGGYGGIGVDGLAKEAGLTSGAFYAHFGSKADAFRLALVDGLTTLVGGITAFREQHGDAWLAPFVDFYCGERLDLELAEACALPTFAADAARADAATRDAYQVELERVAAAIAGGLGGDDARARAWRLMALLAGGAAMARAVPDPGVRAEIVAATKAAAKVV